MADKNKEKENRKKSGKKEEKTGKFREYFESLIVAIILALIIKTFVLQTFQIPTGSMEDGLLVGDHIIVNKLVFGESLPLIDTIFPVRNVKRGDIVIFKYPPDPKVDYIKRVIGLPGETVRIHQHQVWIRQKNSTTFERVEDLGLDEDRYTLQWRNEDRERARAIGADDYYDPDLDPEAKNQLEYEVPEGHYFMLGDHRSVSRDSRYWGTVPRKNITGRAVVIYWSFKNDREEYKETNFFKQVANTFNTIITFPFKTRWTRFLHIIS